MGLKNMNYKKWTILTLSLFLFAVILVGSLNAFIDPFFHFRKPMEFIHYRMYPERYQNDGIVKHWTYDALITGTCMAENFKTTEFDEAFFTSSVKVPFGGATYKEINQIIDTALGVNPDVRIVLRAVDTADFFDNKDAMGYNAYPSYLYDDDPFNDVNYLFNKLALYYSLIDIAYTISNRKSTSFDEYSRWYESQLQSFGKDMVDSSYKRKIKNSDIEHSFTFSDQKTVKENITQNILDTVRKYPDTEFYLFFSPYSIYYFDDLNQDGDLLRFLDAEKYVIELLLREKNIRLFSFFTNEKLICDLGNYKDLRHYSGNVNSWILDWIKDGRYEVTRDNYQDYCEKERDFLLNYDYDALFGL